MEIKGLENITPEQLSQEVMQGATFVSYQYCISLLVVTFKLNSSAYYMRIGDNKVTRGLAFTGVSLLLGWWGFPWGPIYTIGSIITNFRGGNDVTWEIMNALDGKPEHSTLL